MRASGVFATAILLVVVLSGCKAQPKTTRMTVDDLLEISTAMAQSLATSDAMRDRKPDSPPWVLSITKVENLSSDIITDSEKWAVMARLRSSLPIQALRTQKNIVMVIPMEHLRMLQAHGIKDEWATPVPNRREPTHTITATFRSITRYDEERKGRVELYYCEFEMFELGNQATMWTDRFEFKRVAKGHIWD